MFSERFQTAAVIGTGMMGPGIALSLALGGVRSTILSRTAASAAEGLRKARGHAEVLLQNGLADPDRIAEALARLDASADFDGAIAAANAVRTVQLRRTRFIRCPISRDARSRSAR